MIPLSGEDDTTDLLEAKIQPFDAYSPRTYSYSAVTQADIHPNAATSANFSSTLPALAATPTGTQAPHSHSALESPDQALHITDSVSTSSGRIQPAAPSSPFFDDEHTLEMMPETRGVRMVMHEDSGVRIADLGEQRVIELPPAYTPQ